MGNLYILGKKLDILYKTIKYYDHNITKSAIKFLDKK